MSSSLILQGDIVERLRALVRLDRPENGGPYGGTAARECMRAMNEAADEINRLRAEKARLAAEAASYLAQLNGEGAR